MNLGCRSADSEESGDLTEAGNRLATKVLSPSVTVQSQNPHAGSDASLNPEGLSGQRIPAETARSGTSTAFIHTETSRRSQPTVLTYTIGPVGCAIDIGRLSTIRK